MKEKSGPKIEVLRPENPAKNAHFARFQSRHLVICDLTVAQKKGYESRKWRCDMDESKSWYASKAIWGGVVAILSGVAGVFGYAVSPDDQTQLASILAAVGATVGGAAAIFGRIKASKSIGGK